MNRTTLATRLRHRVARDPLARPLRAAALECDSSLRIVGGYVRDAALGKPSTDLDLVASSGVRRLTLALQRTWGTRAFRFSKRGVTTLRFTVDGRRIDLVDATRRGFEADLSRRELTVNAIAYDLLEPRVLDPLRGLYDLNAGRLRMPRPGVFREDPVRALRLARFLAQLPGFTVHQATAREASRAGRALRRASAERIREELDKLLEAPAPHVGLRTLDGLGLTDAVLPELAPLRRCVAGEKRPDVWTHTIEAIALTAGAARLPGRACLREPGDRRILRWSLLLHDISKPETLGSKPDGRPTFHGHESLGARRADALLRRLRLPKRDRRDICCLILNHLRPGHLADAGAPPRGLRRLVREAGDLLPLLVLHAACDARASGSPDAARRWRGLRTVLLRLLELHDRRPAHPPPALLDGRDLMTALDLPPGPRIGMLLAKIREAQEEGTLTTCTEALSLARELTRHDEPGS